MAKFFKPQPKAKAVGQTLKVKISKLNPQGVGVAQYQNKPLFVDGSLTGERLEVRVTEEKSKYLRAKLVNVIQANSQRVKPQCSHFYLCGGCDLQHLAYDAQLKFKKSKVENLFSRQQVIIPEGAWQAAILSDEYHYRRKARIGVQFNKKDEAIVGFRQKSTNHLVNVTKCPALSESIADIFPLLKKIIDGLSVKAAIGHIEVIDTGKITLVIRQLKKLNNKDKSLWLASAQEHHWEIYIDDGKNLSALNGTSPLSYGLGKKINIQFSPQDFIQVNHQVNQAMVEQALTWLELSEQDVVLDLFCGLGNFSLPMAQKTAQVVGVEGVQTMVDKAQANARLNELTNLSFCQADLNTSWRDYTWHKEAFTKVLLDPARAGAHEALHELAPLKVPQILYVSCDPESLARDAQYLCEQGYQIKKIALMDMFSQTKHIETMVLFTL